jgi:hypothetical protein
MPYDDLNFITIVGLIVIKFKGIVVRFVYYIYFTAKPEFVNQPSRMVPSE